MKANLQFHLRIFVVLFKCLDPDNVENQLHPVSAVSVSSGFSTAMCSSLAIVSRDMSMSLDEPTNKY